MRIVTEIVRPELKITIFHWNNKYIFKLESGPFEQTFKLSELDVLSEAEAKNILNEEFIKSSLERFQQMAESFQLAIKSV